MSKRNCLILTQYRDGSDYNDFIGKYYHFPAAPKNYLNQFSSLPIEVVFYEPEKEGEGEFYGYGKITKPPFPDKRDDKYYFVEISDYKLFSKPVYFKNDDGITLESLFNTEYYNPGNSVRKINPEFLDELCLDGGIQLHFKTDAHLIQVLGEQLIDIRETRPGRVSEVYKKTSGIHQAEEETQENLLEEIIADLITFSEEEHDYNGVRVKFKPSYILPDFDSFWMLESILGSQFIKTYITNNLLNISQDVIEKMFDDSQVKFYLNKTNTRIYSDNGLELHKFYDDEVNSEPMTPLYAVNNYDLAILETASEKGTSKIFDSDEK